MGETAAACVRATMKFSFERLSCLLLTHAIRMKPHVIHLAMLEYGSKGAMYHGSMLIAGDAAFKANMKIMCTYVHRQSWFGNTHIRSWSPHDRRWSQVRDFGLFCVSKCIHYGFADTTSTPLLKSVCLD